ncbi:MAG: FMN-dependent NADH-azoreductase [Acidimicrobiales bacterium]
MTRLLRVDASIRTTGSASRAVADSAVEAWRAVHPDAEVLHRDLAASPLPAETWARALTASHAPEEGRTSEQRDALVLVATLASELLGADALVLASPLYNVGVSQHTKAWIDLLVADPRLSPGSTALQDKPALLVVAQGGGYREGAPRHGWDHSTGYLERILRDNFGMDLRTVVADLTLAGVNPAMAHLADAAEQSLSAAHEDATRHGRSLGIAA